jgi:hypothetical protein
LDVVKIDKNSPKTQLIIVIRLEATQNKIIEADNENKKYGFKFDIP